MPTFLNFREAVVTQLNKMYNSGNVLYSSTATADELYDAYLKSFPAGTNNLYRERTEHDCSACRSFIRQAGGIVMFDKNKLVSIWDVLAEGFYQDVANSMSVLVKSKSIDSIFLHGQPTIGIKCNHEQMPTGQVKTWNHFYTTVPASVLNQNGSIAELQGMARTHKQVLERSIIDISLEAIETVQDLIAQNNIYQGATFKSIVDQLAKAKKGYNAASNKELFVWDLSRELKGASNIRGSVIGTLLVDISEGVDLTDAVAKFELKVAPQNYKRPTAVVTKSMIESAQKTVISLGIEDFFYRRYAQLTDITINNLLFADRSIKPVLGVFDDLKKDALVKPDLSKVTEMTIEDFAKNILPKAESVEAYIENRFTSNFVSLIAPVHPDAKNMLKWNNNFSWSYQGEVTDSIKEKVKAAGGNVNGAMRVSLEWFNFDDLDLSVVEPNGNRIYFGERMNRATTGHLDVDENAGGRRNSAPVENITWSSLDKMQTGTYRVVVHNFSAREKSNPGFVAEIEFNGEIMRFEYTSAVKDSERILVAEFNFDKKKIDIKKSLPSSSASKDVWGIKTGTFRKVNAMMLSPNFWDDQEIGNKHYFFMIDGCNNPEQARGFYNEFLKPELNEHRKVFELLGSKLKTQVTTNQLSGLGFSVTQRNSLVCRVSGSINQLVKINF